MTVTCKTESTEWWASPGCHRGSSSGTQKHSACQFDAGVLYRLHRKVGNREGRSADRLTLVTWWYRTFERSILGWKSGRVNHPSWHIQDQTRCLWKSMILAQGKARWNQEGLFCREGKLFGGLSGLWPFLRLKVFDLKYEIYRFSCLLLGRGSCQDRVRVSG